jgi:hypothetical protein
MGYAWTTHPHQPVATDGLLVFGLSLVKHALELKVRMRR